MTDLQSLPETMMARPEPGHNMGAVADDWEAIEVWLNAVTARKRDSSGQTEITYRHHLTKIRWYCETVSKITLSRWTTKDANDFLKFLNAVPVNCLSPKTCKRGQAGWTPFKTQPSKSSAADIQRILHSLYSGWRELGYVRFNPLALQGAGQPRDTNTNRSLSLDLYQMVLRSMENEIPKTVCQRMLICRDQFIFAALRGLGLRATELVSAKMSAFSLFSAPGMNKHYWTFFVEAKTAKGGKQRRLPVTTEVWDAFQRYRRAFGLAPVPAPDEKIALILSPKTLPVFIGKVEVKSTRDRQFFQAWTSIKTRQGLYKIVKTRLKTVADQLKENKDFRYTELLDASPHWLRHTFAKATLSSGQGMREVAGHLGHASLDTAMLYTEQQIMDLIDAWDKVAPGLLATESFLAYSRSEF